MGWLILQANPQYSGLETSIPDGAVLTIPFPLVASLQDYKNVLNLIRSSILTSLTLYLLKRKFITFWSISSVSSFNIYLIKSLIIYKYQLFSLYLYYEKDLTAVPLTSNAHKGFVVPIPIALGVTEIVLLGANP